VAVPDQVSEASPDDLKWLEQAEQHLLQLIRSKYGECQFDHSENDLLLAQRLLTDRHVRKKHLLEAQCIGAVLGNVFIAHSPLRWKRVVNEFGDMLALQNPDVQLTLYPITMISKRLEDRRKIDLVLLYRDTLNNLNLQKQ